MGKNERSDRDKSHKKRHHHSEKDDERDSRHGKRRRRDESRSGRDRDERQHKEARREVKLSERDHRDASRKREEKKRSGTHETKQSKPDRTPPLKRTHSDRSSPAKRTDNRTRMDGSHSKHSHKSEGGRVGSQRGGATGGSEHLDTQPPKHTIRTGGESTERTPTKSRRVSPQTVPGERVKHDRALPSNSRSRSERAEAQVLAAPSRAVEPKPAVSRRVVERLDGVQEHRRDNEKFDGRSGPRRDSERFNGVPGGRRDVERFEGPPGPRRDSDRFEGPPGPRRDSDRFEGPPGQRRDGDRFEGPPGPRRDGDRSEGPPTFRGDTERFEGPTGSRRETERRDYEVLPGPPSRRRDGERFDGQLGPRRGNDRFEGQPVPRRDNELFDAPSRQGSERFDGPPGLRSMGQRPFERPSQDKAFEQPQHSPLEREPDRFNSSSQRLIVRPENSDRFEGGPHCMPPPSRAEPPHLEGPPGQQHQHLARRDMERFDGALPRGAPGMDIEVLDGTMARSSNSRSEQEWFDGPNRHAPGFGGPEGIGGRGFAGRGRGRGRGPDREREMNLGRGGRGPMRPPMGGPGGRGPQGDRGGRGAFFGGQGGRFGGEQNFHEQLEPQMEGHFIHPGGEGQAGFPKEQFHRRGEGAQDEGPMHRGFSEETGVVRLQGKVVPPSAQPGRTEGFPMPPGGGITVPGGLFHKPPSMTQPQAMSAGPRGPMPGRGTPLGHPAPPKRTMGWQGPNRQQQQPHPPPPQMQLPPQPPPPRPYVDPAVMERRRQSNASLLKEQLARMLVSRSLCNPKIYDRFLALLGGEQPDKPSASSMPASIHKGIQHCMLYGALGEVEDNMLPFTTLNAQAAREEYQQGFQSCLKMYLSAENEGLLEVSKHGSFVMDKTVVVGDRG